MPAGEPTLHEPLTYDISRRPLNPLGWADAARPRGGFALPSRRACLGDRSVGRVDGASSGRLSNMRTKPAICQFCKKPHACLGDRNESYLIVITVSM
jgi:hypothetical protein